MSTALPAWVGDVVIVGALAGSTELLLEDAGPMVSSDLEFCCEGDGASPLPSVSWL